MIFHFIPLPTMVGTRKKFVIRVRIWWILCLKLFYFWVHFKTKILIFWIFSNTLRPFNDISPPYHCQLSTFLKCLVEKYSTGVGVPPWLAPKKIEISICFILCLKFFFFWLTFQAKNVHFCIFSNILRPFNDFSSSYYCRLWFAPEKIWN